MNDHFFIDNFRIINEEGRKIHFFNIALGKQIKKLIRVVLEREIAWNELSKEEGLLMEKIEKCIFKVKNIDINSESKL